MRTRSRAASSAAALAVAIAVWGCGSTAPSGSSAPATPSSPAAASSGPSPSVAASAPASAAAPGPSSGAASSPGLSVTPDPTLLGFLPAGGLALTYDADSTAQVAQDPTLASSVSHLAIALALPAAGTSSAPPGSDLAVVSVIRVRDVGLGEAWFRGYRDSYDDAACANAGGATRNAQMTVGTTTVFIGSCAGGSFTYHARVTGQPVVISITSVGPANLGRTIMEGLDR